MGKRLRNIFDQYTQRENHITNSLLLVLNHNRSLLRKILSANGIKLSGKQLNLLSQIAPKKTDNKTSVPDGYIYTDDLDFCIGIETKIKPTSLKKSQLIRHLDQLSVYNQSYLLALTPDVEIPKIVQDLQADFPNLKFVSWIKLIKLLIKEGPDKGKNYVGKFVYEEFLSYMERHYEMTPFTGFNFRDGYDVDLASHYVKRITESITNKITKTYPECNFTRPKIGVGSGYPWQSWSSEKKIQDAVHFTISVRPEKLHCLMILPNKCNTEWGKLKAILTQDSSIKKFRQALKKIYDKAPDAAYSVVSFRQRHFKGQTVAIIDGFTELNIAMLLGLGRSKKNDIWWNLLREIANTKGRYNYQLEAGYHLPYDKIKELKTQKAASIIEYYFKSLKPVYDMISQG